MNNLNSVVAAFRSFMCHLAGACKAGNENYSCLTVYTEPNDHYSLILF